MSRRTRIGVAQFPLHSSMTLELFLVTIASLLLNIAIATSDGTSNNANCAPVICGDLNIRYPFTLGGVQPPECGLPSLELTCDGGRAYLTRSFRELLYRVYSISYDTNSLVLAADTSYGTSCGIPDFNVSSGLALYPLSISNTNKNLVLLINDCPIPHENQVFSPCVNRTIGAYISERREGEVNNPPQWVQKNCSSVIVPVRAFPGMEELARNYTRLISEGFLLEWSVTDSRDCDACRQRGGECRFVQSSFQCHTSRGNDKRKKQSTKIILIVSLSAATSLILTSVLWIMYRQKESNIFFIQKYTGNDSNIEKILKGYDSLTLKRYRYSELRKITGSFKEKLGEGGYGMVFKGNLEDGRAVAVKILKGSKGNGEEFLNEVVSIRRTSHVNVVNLLGFCLYGSKRALIYEYMANGSLDKYIYAEESKMAIGWEKLQHIAIGIARGLEYLHRGCNTRIIHFDIKPHNVLLDEDFCPKIADFGLAKLCHLKDSALSIAQARGTIGFIAPEVFSRGFGIVSTKSDVYSYGMMLLEMVGGRTDMKDNTENSSQAYFPNWIYNRLVKDLQSHEVTCETEEIARQMTLVGLWCIQTSPVDRPSMSRVIEMLENNINESEIPPMPFLSRPSHPQCCSSYS